MTQARSNMRSRTSHDATDDESRYRAAHRAHGRESFFKYCSPTTGITVLRTGRLRWSSPLLFNDPFDVPREAYLDFTPDELQTAIGEEFARLIETGGTTTHPEFAFIIATLRERGTPEFRSEMAASLREYTKSVVGRADAAMDEFRHKWKTLIPSLRILCLSELNDSSSMWHHYADAHRGVVLELACIDELDPAWLLARPVIYQRERPLLGALDTWVRIVTGQQPIRWHDLFADYHYVKTPDWSPEHEWRVVSYADDGDNGLHSDIGFDPRELAAVYLGASIHKDAEADIRGLIASRYPDTNIFRARHEQETARIVFETVA
jgi:hypothetical protein